MLDSRLHLEASIMSSVNNALPKTTRCIEAPIEPKVILQDCSSSLATKHCRHCRYTIIRSWSSRCTICCGRHFPLTRVHATMIPSSAKGLPISKQLRIRISNATPFNLFFLHLIFGGPRAWCRNKISEQSPDRFSSSNQKYPNDDYPMNDDSIQPIARPVAFRPMEIRPVELVFPAWNL